MQKPLWRDKNETSHPFHVGVKYPRKFKNPSWYSRLLCEDDLEKENSVEHLTCEQQSMPLCGECKDSHHLYEWHGVFAMMCNGCLGLGTKYRCATCSLGFCKSCAYGEESPSSQDTGDPHEWKAEVAQYEEETFVPSCTNVRATISDSPEVGFLGAVIKKMHILILVGCVLCAASSNWERILDFIAQQSFILSVAATCFAAFSLAGAFVPYFGLCSLAFATVFLAPPVVPVTRLVRQVMWRVSEPVVLSQALVRSCSKAAIVFTTMTPFAVLFYADIGTDVGSIYVLIKNGYFGCGSTILMFSCLAAAWGTYTMYQLCSTQIQSSRWKLVIVALSLMQMVPAGCLIFGIVLMCVTNTAGELEDLLQHYCVLQIMAETGMVESFMESIPSVLVNLYLALSPVAVGFGADDRVRLFASASVGIVSLSKAAADIDKRSQVSGWIGGVIPAVVGVADVSSIAYAAVFCCRLLWCAHRLLLFPLFHVVTASFLRIRTISCGGLLLLGLDCTLQLLLIKITIGGKRPAKLLFALVNTITPAEPLLHGGEPIWTTSISWSAALHGIEFFGVCALGMATKSWHHNFQLLADPFACYPFLGCGAAGVLNLPLLLFIRLCVVYRVKPCRDLCVQQLQLHANTELDDAERRLPKSLCMFVLRRLTGHDGRTLVMNDKGLRDGSCYLVACALMYEYADLQFLSLAHNPIGALGLGYIAHAFSWRCSLRWLSLSNCDLGDAGAHCLGQALKGNMRLQALSISENHISDRGAAQVANGLREAQLWCFGAAGNEIADQGAKHIADVLQVSITLQLIALDKNYMGDLGAMDLSRALARNSSLRELSLRSNNFSQEGRAALTSAAECRTSDTSVFLNL